MQDRRKPRVEGTFHLRKPPRRCHTTEVTLAALHRIKDLTPGAGARIHRVDPLSIPGVLA